MVTSDNNLGIGKYSNYYWNGNLDEIRIYNRSLSAEEVQRLYEMGSNFIEWNDWEDKGIVSDEEVQTSSTEGPCTKAAIVFLRFETGISSSS